MIVFRRTTWIDCSSADLTLANIFVVSFSSFIVLGPETHQTGRGHERFAQLLEQVDGEEAEADDALGEGERLQNGPVARFVQRVERFAYLSHSFGFGLWLVFCFFLRSPQSAAWQQRNRRRRRARRFGDRNRKNPSHVRRRLGLSFVLFLRLSWVQRPCGQKKRNASFFKKKTLRTLSP